MKQLTTTARVQLTVEVDVASWGEGCTTGQVYDQASREATGAVRCLIQKSNENATTMRLVGTPKVQMVTVAA